MPLGSQFPLRRSPRINVRIPLTLLVGPQKAKIAHKAVTVDFSPLGARVRTGTPLSPGQTVEMLLSGRLKHPIRSRVVCVGKAGLAQQGEAGIEFLRRLPAPA